MTRASSASASWLVAVVFGLAGASCSHGRIATRTVPGPVAVRRLQPGSWSYTYLSGFVEPVRAVARDHVAWRKLATELGRPYSPWNPDIVPGNVNFDEEMLLVVGLGSRPTGGYSIFVESARVTATGALEVLVCSDEPPPASLVTAAVTEAVDIARVAQFKGEVTFVERKGVPSCGIGTDKQ
jgi:hypothetical protein